jgi:hypothetical protein
MTTSRFFLGTQNGRSTFGYSFTVLIARTQGPDLESEDTATLGRLQWPSCRAHSQVGPLSHRRLIQGHPRPHKKEIWLPVTQRRSLCG